MGVPVGQIRQWVRPPVTSGVWRQTTMPQCWSSKRGTDYVLTMAGSAELPTGAGTFRSDALVHKVPKRAWQKLSAGPGAKGTGVLRLGRHQPRRSGTGLPAATDPTQPHHWPTRLLPLPLHRTGTPGHPGQSRGRAPSPPPLLLARRVITLAMPAHAYLAVVRADEHEHRPTPDDMSTLACNEILRLGTRTFRSPREPSESARPRLRGSAGNPYPGSSAHPRPDETWISGSEPIRIAPRSTTQYIRPPDSRPNR